MRIAPDRTKLINMKHLKQFLAIALALVLLNACKKDDNNGIATEPLNVTLHLQAPDKVTITHYGTLTLTLTELNKNEKVEKVYHNTTTNDFQLSIPAGSYEVRATGTVSYTQSSTTYAGEVTTLIPKLNILTSSTYSLPITLKTIVSDEDKDLLIEEIFITGTTTPQGKQYLDDSYFKIYNPTSRVLYADGLLLVQSAFQTNDKQTYTPNIMNQAFTANAVYQIPGNGKQYPVAAGESIIIALTAINHKELNSNSIDLKKANFEIKDEADDEDPGNAAVPNMFVKFEDAVINRQAINAFALARMPKGITQLEKYSYTYKDESGFDLVGDAVKILNTWVIDAVNLAQKEDFQWLVTDVSLDSGWTYASESQGDVSRYRKGVRRKVTGQQNGHRVLKDTNNSIEDFDARVTPSLFNF